MSFFEDVFGFDETDRQTVHEQLELDGTTLRSHANGRQFEAGELSTPSLAELRSETFVRDGRLTVREIVGDVQDLHLDPKNAGAFFQVASQFNLLEMVSPEVSPAEGITIYEHDRTQGPACAIACAAGTVYRNWFAPVGADVGQSTDNQIDCLAEMTTPLGAGHWTMRNGYALATSSGLAAIDERVDAMTAVERDEAIGHLCIGVHQNTEVTLGNAGHLVTQAYCSALPVAYSPHPASDWEAFARIVLDASYEAALHAAARNAQRTGNRTAYLTLLGGGAFGNAPEWIVSAMQRAFDLFADVDIDVAIVSYGSPSTMAQTLLTNE